jgi:hypothetical protein
MRNPARLLLSLLALGLLIIVGCPILFVLSLSRTLQEAQSPDGQRRVELIRIDGLDRNYIIRVDGTRVWNSPDFSPRDDIPYREALVWNATGNVVVFEVANHRVCGIDVNAKRVLTDAELLALELAPEPRLWDYGYEAEWPGIGRAQQFDPTVVPQ